MSELNINENENEKDIDELSTKCETHLGNLYHLCATGPCLAVGPVHPGEAVFQGSSKMLQSKYSLNKF